MSQQINLYEERLRPSREWLNGRRLLLAAAILFALLTLIGVRARFAADRAEGELAGVRSEVAASQQQLAATAKTRAALQVSALRKAELDSARAQLASRQAAMALLDSGRLGNGGGFSALMTGFSHLAANDLWLTAFSVSAGGQEIEIRGRLLAAASLPAYVQRLGDEPAFAGRHFAALEMQRPAAAGKSDAGAAGTGAAGDGAVADPRVIDFVLRSEKGGDAEAAAGVKK